MINRRRFMAGAALGAAGVAGAVIFTGHSPIELPSAEAASGDKFKYRGRNVEITPLPNSAHILVDGRHGVHLMRDGNAFSSHLLPFNEFTSPRQAAQALIDGAAETLFIL
jgi:hypothetical protein